MRKRKSYKRENISNKNDNKNIISIDLFKLECKKNSTGELYLYDCSDLHASGNFQLAKIAMLYLHKYNSQNQETMFGKKHSILQFFKFMKENKIDTYNKIDYGFLVKYKEFLQDKYTSSTQSKRFIEIRSFLKYISHHDTSLVNKDVLDNNFPNNVKVYQKNPIEKDFERSNNGYSDDDCINYIQYSINIITEEGILSEKMLAYFVLFSFFTGANPSVLKDFTHEDLLKLSVDFKYIDFIKNKGRKGIGGAPIKIQVKNIMFGDVKFSDMSLLILKEKEKRVDEWKTHKNSNDLFLFPKNNRSNKDSFTYNWRSLGRNYLQSINTMFSKRESSIKSNFTCDKSRKYFERNIMKITNDVTITSSLLGHSKRIAENHYLKTKSGIDGHQKLVVTQDLIDGFSRNKHTDNFMIYNKLLELYGMDLESAIRLAKQGFKIDDIIKGSKK